MAIQSINQREEISPGLWAFLRDAFCLDGKHHLGGGKNVGQTCWTRGWGGASRPVGPEENTRVVVTNKTAKSVTWQKRQAPFLRPSMVDALMISSISGMFVSSSISNTLWQYNVPRTTLCNVWGKYDSMSFLGGQFSTHDDDWNDLAHFVDRWLAPQVELN